MEKKPNNTNTENLSSTIPKFSQKRPPINIIENENESETSLSSDESESELAEKWLKAKQKKLQELNMQIKNEKKLEEKNQEHTKHKSKSKGKQEKSNEQNGKPTINKKDGKNSEYEQSSKIEITKENIRKDESSQERTHRSKKLKEDRKIIAERNFTFQKNETNASEERETSKDRKFKIENLQTSYEKKTNLTDFNQNDLSSFRNYIDRKIENLNPINQKTPSPEDFINSDISTPQPQKNVKKPYDLNVDKENKMDTAGNDEEILASFANFLKENTKFKNEKGNMINFLSNNQDKLLESKIKEFLSIKDRILDKSFNKTHIPDSSIDAPQKEKEELPSKKHKTKKKVRALNKESKENINKSNILEEHHHHLIPPKKQMTPKMRENELDEIHTNTLIKSNLNVTTSTKNEYLFSSMPAAQSNKNLFFSTRQSEQNFEEIDAINNLLNKTEDFYENDLLSIIQEVEKEELKRKEDKRYYLPKEKNERAQKENQSSSYVDSDASVRYINQQIAEMERKKGGFPTYK